MGPEKRSCEAHKSLLLQALEMMALRKKGSTPAFRPRLFPRPPWSPPPTSPQKSPPSSAASDAALLGARKYAIPGTLRRRRMPPPLCVMAAPPSPPSPLPSNAVESGVRSTGAGAEGESRATACRRDGHRLDVCPEGAAEDRPPRSSGGLRDRGPDLRLGGIFRRPPPPAREPERPPNKGTSRRHGRRRSWSPGRRRTRSFFAISPPGLLVLGGRRSRGLWPQGSDLVYAGGRGIIFRGGSSGPGRASGQMATGLSRRSQRGLGLPGPPPPAAPSRSRPSRAAP
ncbi:basic salivary proline-rich protein 2-like [Peromyscus californicus insignis]|uniref:basic salivary proline-rich protein 2-like n=1 Tax=Peromyscus californicus insignis TaxID=564181 RepID=UPI0022A69437|nr:basic salivary proline-rich protein 2-like [Peromyscus californicus insignis]